MSPEPLISERASIPGAPFSVAVRATAQLWLSGQVGIDLATGELAAGGAAEQLAQIFANLDVILEDAGKQRSDVIRVTLYLADIEDYAAVNEVYAGYFADPYPARTALAVAALPVGARIEADVIVA